MSANSDRGKGRGVCRWERHCRPAARTVFWLVILAAGATEATDPAGLLQSIWLVGTACWLHSARARRAGAEPASTLHPTRFRRFEYAVPRHSPPDDPGWRPVQRPRSRTPL